MSLQLSHHQLEAIRKLKNGSILFAGVGSGKTRTALAYYYFRVCQGSLPVNGVGSIVPPSKPRPLYVITTARKRDELDWQFEALPFLIHTDPNESPHGLGITVDSYNNISNYTDVKDAFFIFDEQRLVGKGKWVESFLKIAKHNEWILLSATPGDSWMDYLPVFLANGFYENRSHFLLNHVIYNRFTKYPKIDRYIGEKELERLRASILVEMPFSRHTTRHEHYVTCDYDKKLMARITQDRWNIYEDEPIRDAGAFSRIQRRLVASHPSRLKKVKEILQKHDRLIIFYWFDYELEILRELNKEPYLSVAEWNGHKHEPVPVTERWVYLVQYSAGSEAWNCITTDAMLFYGMQYSYKIYEQCQGRIDRLNTSFEDLHYYILTSDTPIDKTLSEVITKKKDFNERAFFENYQN